MSNGAQRLCYSSREISWLSSRFDDNCTMGFNRCKMEGQRRQAAEKKAAEQRATDPQVLEEPTA